MLKANDAIELAEHLYKVRMAERETLDEVRRYWKGRQKLPAVYDSKSGEVIKVLARSSRVNIIPIIINSVAQAMYVDGFRANDGSEDIEVWNAWQANRMDRHQMGIHRATTAYGRSYVTVVPGDSAPVWKGYSPRQMTALYGEDPHWPDSALSHEGHGSWRLWDEEAIYFLDGKEGKFTFTEARPHRAPVCPVIRHVDEEDLDVDDEVSAQSFLGEPDHLTIGQVGPYMAVQDQIDITTFGLKVAENAGAFRQRYAIGWVAENEAEQLKASAAKLWTIDEDPSDVTIGEFGQTDLGGYIESREASLRHAAALSQTPLPEFATLIQMSADALAAAYAGKERKIEERQTLAGESHEQEFWLTGHYMGIDIPEDAQVVWRETSARSFASTVDGLGKLAQMLGVPPQELWEKIPGVTKSDVERWKAIAEQGDAFAQMEAMLTRQAQEV